MDADWKKTIVQSGPDHSEINNYFKGTFDGGGHTISGLYINAPDSSRQGLFGYLGEGGTIKNLGVDGTITARQFVGGVCGENEKGTITSCYHTGAVTGKYDVGGVCGCNNYGGTIENCYNTASVTGSFGPEGVCGDAMSTGTLTNCFYNSDVAADTNTGVTGKTASQFASGEVAYLLQAAQTAPEGETASQVWGQSVKGDATDGSPVLTSDPAKAIYKVTFDSNSDSTVNDQFVNYNDTVTKPPDPIKDGYAFGGWYKNIANEWKFDSDTVTENITLYADWSASGSGGSSTGGSTGDGTSSGGTGDDDSSTGNNPSGDNPGTDTPSGDEPIVEPDEPSEPSDEPSGEPAEPGDNPSDEPSEPTIEAQVIYRLYNRNSGEHFYTASKYERDSVEDAGWAYEGEAWVAPVKSTTPVYRLYSGTDHHYTKDANEKAWLEAQGWTYEGISWYSDDAEGVELYRLFNPNVNPSATTNNSGSHHYTTNKAESDFLASIGWQAEGVAWYGMK